VVAFVIERGRSDGMGVCGEGVFLGVEFEEEVGEGEEEEEAAPGVFAGLEEKTEGVAGEDHVY